MGEGKKFTENKLLVQFIGSRKTNRWREEIALFFAIVVPALLVRERGVVAEKGRLTFGAQETLFKVGLPGVQGTGVALIEDGKEGWRFFWICHPHGSFDIGGVYFKSGKRENRLSRLPNELVLPFRRALPTILTEICAVFPKLAEDLDYYAWAAGQKVSGTM
ncbi:MAG: hypothetical protein NUW02_03750 [Candidatus Campbellbacteria bacterium]|nr:hypothetical protein [Candidatus Campbellbacteria bacterium]